MFLLILKLIACDGKLGAQGLLNWVCVFRCSSLNLLGAPAWGVLVKGFMIAEVSLLLVVLLPQCLISCLSTDRVTRQVRVIDH